MLQDLVCGYGPHPEPEVGYLEDPVTWDTTYNPKARYANILLDDWFKRAFGSEDRKRLMELFLQELIPERKIVGLKYVSQEHVNLFPGKKDIRVDVECTDAEGARFVVEVQVAPQNWFYERALYYSAVSLMKQMNKGVDEYVFPPVYFIGLMDFSFHRNTSRVMYRYGITDLETGKPMTDKLNLIFLELPNCRKAMTPEASVLDNFCYALHNLRFLPDRPLELRQEIFELLFESADIAKFTPDEKIKYDKDMTTDRDRRNQLKKAVEDGMKEGREEEKEAFMKAMKAAGLSEEEMAKVLECKED